MVVVVATTGHLVITLNGAAIRTGPEHSSADKGRSTITIEIGPIGIATDHLCEILVAKEILAILGPELDRPAVHHLAAGIHTNQLDPLQVDIHRLTTAEVWTNVRNACHKPTCCPARLPLGKGRPLLLLDCLPPLTTPPPLQVSTTHPSRPARGNPGRYIYPSIVAIVWH